MSFIKHNKGFCIIFLVAAFVRFFPAASYQFSYDELCGIRNSLFDSWDDMVHLGVSLDTHPILVQLIINFMAKIFGFSEFWIKLPFLLFSLAAVIYAYLFCDKWFGRLPALITAGIFSFSYLFLFYAPLARMYAGGVFFCTATTFYLFNLCFEEEKKHSDYVLFVLFILLAALNNHLSCLYALSCGAFGLFFQKKKDLLRYSIACFCAIVLYLPHLPVTLTQLTVGGIGHGQDGWLPAPDKYILFSIIKTYFGTGYIWIMYVLLLAIALVLRKTDFDKKTLYLFFLFFFNYGVIHLYSVLKAPILQNSVMLFSAPAFIFAFSSLIRIHPKNCFAIGGPLCIALLFQSVWVKNFLVNAVYNQNDEQSKVYCRLEDKFGKGKVGSFYGGAQPYFVVHYELKYKRPFNYHLRTSIKEFKSAVRASPASLFVLGDPSYTELKVAKEVFPYVAEHFESLSVNYYVLSRQPLSTGVMTEETTVNYSSFSLPSDYEYSGTKEELSNIDSLNEYPFGVKAPLGKVALKEGQVIIAKLKVISKEPLKDVGFNYSITNKKDSILFFGGSDLNVFYVPDSSGYFVYSEMFIGSEFKKWLKEESSVKFFLWNRGRKKFSVTDCEVVTMDYWHDRWNWWE